MWLDLDGVGKLLWDPQSSVDAVITLSEAPSPPVPHSFKDNLLSVESYFLGSDLLLMFPKIYFEPCVYALGHLSGNFLMVCTQ